MFGPAITTIDGLLGFYIGFLVNNELADFDALDTTWDNRAVSSGPEVGNRRRPTALDPFGRNESLIFR